MSANYRNNIGDQKALRRQQQIINGKQSTLNPIAKGEPAPTDGYDGQETFREVENKGTYHYIKRNGKWHGKLYRPYSETLQDEIDKTVVVETSTLENDSVTITAGDGLKDGGIVSLGGTTTINIDVSDFVGEGLINDGSENIDVLFDGGPETFGTSDSFDFVTSLGRQFNAMDETSTTTISPNASAASGTLSEVARSDHTHAITTAVANSIVPDATATEGSSTSFSRSDHTHGIVTETPVNVDLNVNAEGVSTGFARADHKHYLDESIIPTWTGLHTFQNGITANTAGTVDIDVEADFDAAVQMDQVTINTTDGDFAIAGSGKINNTVDMQNGPDDVIYWGTSNTEYRITSDASSHLEIDGTALVKIKPNKVHIGVPEPFGLVTDNFAIRVKVDEGTDEGQHFQSGAEDLKQNYAMISSHNLQSASYDSNFGNWS